MRELDAEGKGDKKICNILIYFFSFRFVCFVFVESELHHIDVFMFRMKVSGIKFFWALFVWRQTESLQLEG